MNITDTNPAHRRKQRRTKQANYQIRNREQGRCAVCGALSPAFYRCLACRVKIREAQKLRMRRRAGWV